MKIGLETETFHLFIQHRRLDIFQLIENIADWELDGIQINIVQKKRGSRWGALESIDDDYLEKVKRHLEYHRLYAEIDTNSTNPNHLKMAIQIASKIGADIVRTCVVIKGGVKESLTEAEGNIKSIIPLLKKYNIKLAIENHEYETSTELIGLINNIDDKNVGVLCDVGNSMMAWEDPINAVKSLAPYAISAHFKDHIVVEDGDDLKVYGVEIGTGSIDLKECFKILMNDSSLSRINIEMCNPYITEFKRDIGTGGLDNIQISPFIIKEKPKELRNIESREYDYSTKGNLNILLSYQEAAALESIKYVTKLRNELNSNK